MKSDLPVVNHGTKAMLLELEPEGETIEIGPGETCHIEFDGDMRAIGLAIEIKDDIVLLYAMCGKQARLVPA